METGRHCYFRHKGNPEVLTGEAWGWYFVWSNQTFAFKDCQVLGAVPRFEEIESLDNWWKEAREVA